MTILQADLFTTTDPHELTYAANLASLVQSEEEYRIDNGIIPNWIESDFLLSKDQRRLLTLIADHAGYLMADGDYLITQYGETGARRVSRFTVDMGMLAEANSKAVLNAALDRGLVSVTRDNSASANRIDLTRRGRYYLDLCEHDDAWDDMED